ncbi:MAG: exosortase/archaeosortase family protein, partial [Kiritimatiellae bacterium]|nr:exosortase/archaeosortase family protein [Kiritimatiellia bacterium]
MRGLQKTVLYLATVVFLVWVVFHFGMISGDENGKIRFSLGILFALMILVRRKEKTLTFFLSQWITPFATLTGTVLSLTGIIFNVGQFEWLGLILLVFSALHWALSAKYSRDVLLAMFVLYWIHPLPGQLSSHLQLAMQMLTVQAAEWVLHCFNVRVWADGIMLNTGFQTFLVPQSCSGMATAVTVLLIALGVGIFIRLKWFETAILLVVGTVQVFVLNILCICFMIVWPGRMPHEWAGTFLHDTRGFLLLAAIFLVLIEAVFLKIWKVNRTIQNKGIETGEVERPDKATVLPEFWRILNRWVWVGLTVLVLATVVTFAVYKRRPYHRAMMISDVVDSLMEHNLAKAARAVNEALKLKPGDRALVSKRIYVMVLRGRFREALTELDTLSGSLSTMETVMKSCSLMSLNRSDEAIALIESLPEAEKHVPGVAMIRAECAAGKDKPAVVASNVLIASTSPLLINRVRGLFPYLGAHKQWRTIMDSDRENMPYRECTHVLVAVYASLELNDIFRASKALKAGLTTWPNEPRFIDSLFMLAARRPGSEWENLFAENIETNVKNLDADQLASYMEYCFKLSRPDLAWLLYLKLRKTDPRDPALYFVPAQFGDDWFSFRCHELGIEAGSKRLRIDLKPFCLYTKNIEPFKSFWKKVPLNEELSADSAEKKRTEYLNLCITEMEKRQKNGKINRRIQMAYPTALFMAGRYKEAEAVLDELEQKYPDAGRELLFQRAVFYNQQERWQDSYEALMRYQELLSGSGDNLNADIMLINAMINMNMGICAMEVAERAREA